VYLEYQVWEELTVKILKSMGVYTGQRLKVGVVEADNGSSFKRGLTGDDVQFTVHDESDPMLLDTLDKDEIDDYLLGDVTSKLDYPKYPPNTTKESTNKERLLLFTLDDAEFNDRDDIDDDADD